MLFRQSQADASTARKKTHAPGHASVSESMVCSQLASKHYSTLKNYSKNSSTSHRPVDTISFSETTTIFKSKRGELAGRDHVTRCLDKDRPVTLFDAVFDIKEGSSLSRYTPNMYARKGLLWLRSYSSARWQ